MFSSEKQEIAYEGDFSLVNAKSWFYPPQNKKRLFPQNICFSATTNPSNVFQKYIKFFQG